MMSMRYCYESHPVRAQKRLVINRCFGMVRDQMHSSSKSVTYVTFGGQYLHDVLDFVEVFRTS